MVMFCINCGKEINDNDAFCQFCGQSTDIGTNKDVSNMSRNIDSGNFNKYAHKNTIKMGGILKSYFKRPITFFEEFKGQNLLKESIIMVVILALLNGIVNLIESSAIVTSLMKSLNKISSLVGAASSYNTYGQINSIQTVLDTLIDKGQLFFFGIVYAAIFIGATTLIVLILNATILKNKISFKDIFFISTMSYLPVIIGMLVGSVITYLSIGIGILFVLVGYLAGAITLFNGIKKYSEENENKVLFIMLIYFAIILITMLFVIQYQTKEFVLKIIQTIYTSRNPFNSLADGLF